MQSTLEFDYEMGAPPRVELGHGSRLDQFNAHLSPLGTVMGSRRFRLRAVHTGDGDRRLVG